MQKVELEDYKCYNKQRVNSNSGGVCIGVHRSLTPGCTEYVVPTRDIQGLKLSKNFFGLRRDIIVLNVYNSQEESSYKKNNKSADETTTLETLSTIFEKIPTHNDIIIVGDFNSRIAETRDYIIKDKHDPTPSEFELIDRTSRDKKTNSNCAEFLDLIIGNQLIILNGRTIGDLEGNLTCLKHNGN